MKLLVTTTFTFLMVFQLSAAGINTRKDSLSVERNFVEYDHSMVSKDRKKRKNKKRKRKCSKWARKCYAG